MVAACKARAHPSSMGYYDLRRRLRQDQAIVDRQREACDLLRKARDDNKDALADLLDRREDIQTEMRYRNQ